MRKILENKVCYLLVCYLLIVFGYIFSAGFYFLPGLIFLLISWITCLLFYRRKIPDILTDINLGTLLPVVLIAFVALGVSMYGGLYQTNVLGLMTLGRFLSMLALLVSFAYLIKPGQMKSISFLIIRKFWVLFFLAFALRVLMIVSSPSPFIDVFGIQKIAPRAILEGNNPYSLVYRFSWQKVPLDVYSYGPFDIFLNFPAVLLFGDPRVMQIIAEMGVAVIIYLIGKKIEFVTKNNQELEIFSLIFLFNPRALFIIEQAWIDPIVVFLIFLFAYFLFVQKKNYLAFFILGLAIATKQYCIILLPFLFFGGYKKLKYFLVLIFPIMLTSLPFLLWNAHDFIRDVVFFNLTIQTSRYDSLSVNTLFHNILGRDLPTILVLILNLSVLLFLLRFLKKNAFSITFASGIFIFTIYLFYRLAFIHYYYFAGSLVYLSIVLLIFEESKSK